MAKNSLRNLQSSRFLKRIVNHDTVRAYRDKEIVFAQKDAADALFYIRGGNVKLTVVSNRGKKAVIGILGEGDLFGECCLEKQALRFSTATAIGQSTIARVTKGTISRLIRQEPGVAALFISHLLSRISSMGEHALDQHFNKSELRLARVLVHLANFGEPSARGKIALKVSQQTLAEMIGTTRSRVSYFMNRFQKKGFIQYNPGLQVHGALLAFLLSGGSKEIQ